jgi:TonB family protein
MIRETLPKILLLCGLLAASLLDVAARDAYTQSEIKHSRRHYERARKLYRKGLYGQAIDELDRALSVREIYPEAQWLLAHALAKAKRPREAFETLRSIDARRRESAEFWKLSGQVFLLINKTAEAEKALLKAIGHTPRPDPEARYYLGLVKLRQGENEEAIHEAEQALRTSPRFALARRLISDAALVRGDYRLAERELALYLRSVRNQSEEQNLRQRLSAIRALSQARDSQSSFAAPRIDHAPKPTYTAEARRNRIEGTVRLEVLFGRDGQVEQAIVTQGLGFGLDDEAARAARQIKFTPGHLDDRPVSFWAGVVYRFSILEVEPLIPATPASKTY